MLISTGRLSPEELELFYDSWKNIVTINGHAQTSAAYKTVEVVNIMLFILIFTPSSFLVIESFGPLS